MGKYSDITASPWEKMTLYSESIPHLFHWDLSYLWILEKERDLRPESWRERIEAWRHLVSLFFAGELQVETEVITEPFLSYTRPYGLEKIHWVCPRNTNKKIGVLSSTVLVRPLPDFKFEDCNQWLPPPEKGNPILLHFISLAIRELKRDTPQKSHLYRTKLAGILEREFEKSGLLKEPPPGRPVSFPALCEISWVQTSQEACVETIRLFVRETAGAIKKVFVPRCRRCNRLLLKSQGKDPITIEDNRVPIKCDNPECEVPSNELSLEDFLIWWRDTKKEVVVWDDGGVFSIPEKGLPPRPTIRGIEVQFEWNPALIEGEGEKRFLELRFPDKKVVRRKVEEIFFKKILVPGNFEAFNGLPVRPEWIDVLKNPKDIRVEKDTAPRKVTYPAVRLNGWPVSVDFVFSDLRLHPEEKLAVGIYPDPSILPKEWRWYRVFLHGMNRKHYRVETIGKEIFPWLIELTKEFPNSFSVISRETVDIGTTFCSAENSKIGKDTHSEFTLGIDFGTSNSIIYFLPPGEEFEKIENDTIKYCVRPSEFNEAVRWLANIEDLSLQTVGDFLPNDKYREGGGDSFIIPSALWCFNNDFLIRWESEQPSESASPLSGFKWDGSRGDYSLQRKAFIKEILLLAIPLIIKKAAIANKINTWDLKFNLGFAFPLAFGDVARRKMNKLYQEDILKELRELTSFEYESYSLNESLSCIKLLGRANSRDTFFVADMGGGTLDLALFTANSEEPEQIGSIRFAGEHYLEGLSRKRNVNIWKFRDLISKDKCHKEYGGDRTSQIVLNKFVGISFEFLRTMIEAYRRNKPDQTIYLVLAGNGWHLVEAFNEQTEGIGARRVFQSFYDHIVEMMNDRKLVLSKLSKEFRHLQSLKHLVAIGALKNACLANSRINELTSEKPAAKLPAGRGFKFTDPDGNWEAIIGWYELIGGRLPFEIFSGRMLQEMDLEFDFDDMPPLKGSWKSFILDLFGAKKVDEIPHPNVHKLKEYIIDSIKDQPPLLLKGPLQLIMERHWIDLLEE